LKEKLLQKPAQSRRKAEKGDNFLEVFEPVTNKIEVENCRLTKSSEWMDGRLGG
jgi:hypothetical protein